MKRAIVVLAALSSFAVVAGETKTTELKAETKTTKNGKETTKVEEKTTRDPDGLMNSTTDSAKATREVTHKGDGGVEVKTERMVEHDAPGMKNDTKTKVTTTVEKDAKGNVIKEDVKVKAKN